MATLFNDLLNEKVYPKLVNGMYPMILTGIGTPVKTKNALGEETEYVPVRLEVIETGRPVVYNVFASQFKSFFISPIQTQIDPDNQREWATAGELIRELIETKAPLNVWVERVTYIGSQGEKTTTNYTFFEPTKKQASNVPAKEANPEDISL